MNEFQKLVKDHEELYEKALKKLPDVKTDKYYEDVEDLISRIVNFSSKTRLIDEYRWLKNVLMKWKVVYVSIFNKPKIIELHPPIKTLIPEITPSKRFFSENDIENWIQRTAYHRAFSRISSTEDEKKEDYIHAEIMLASEIFSGNINFASQIPASSYPRLESIWLKDIKLLRAYFVWEDIVKKHGEEHGHDNDDYNKVCDYLHKMLVNLSIKIDPIEFTYVRKYLDKH